MEKEKIKGEFDEQSKFLAEKLKQAVVFELTEASKKGELKYITPEQIEAVAEIVYQYYAEYNKPYGGGAMRANINHVIEEALEAYVETKAGKEDKIPSSRSDIIAAKEAFKKAILGINLTLDPELKSFTSMGMPHEFVTQPIYEFGWVGNAGSFSMARENEQGVPVREQYFMDGVILPEPIVTYYVNGDWQSEPPTRQY